MRAVDSCIERVEWISVNNKCTSTIQLRHFDTCNIACNYIVFDRQCGVCSYRWPLQAGGEATCTRVSLQIV